MGGQDKLPETANPGSALGLLGKAGLVITNQGFSFGLFSFKHTEKHTEIEHLLSNFPKMTVYSWPTEPHVFEKLTKDTECPSLVTKFSHLCPLESSAPSSPF